MKILLHNCQEASNIGNGFYDRTLKSMIKRVLGDADIYDGQELPHLVWRDISGYRKKNTFFYGEYGDVDAFVFSGPMIWEQVTKYYGLYLIAMRERYPQARFYFLNMGGMLYSDSERNDFLSLIRKIRPHAISCRDDSSYSLLNNEASYVHRGIDAAFFLSKIFKTYSTGGMGEYFTLCFDHSNEPSLKFHDLRKFDAEYLNEHVEIKPIRISKKLRGYIESFRNLPAEVFGIKVIRPQHGLIDVSAKQIFCKPNTFISEQAPSYVNLYSNTSFTISDRVHACVASLSFGKPARLIANTGRSALFDRVGLAHIKEKFVELDMEKLDYEFLIYEDFLREAFSF